jgi:glycosyltransferase involved in cell wall biosynthesis
MARTAERALKVALDATPLLGERTGIGEFCARVLEHLVRRPDLQVGGFAVSLRGRGAIAGLLPEGARALGLPGPGLPATLLHRCWQRWPFPPAELYMGKVDVVHGTNFVVPPARSAAMVVTVHDLTPLHDPQLCQPSARAYPALVKKAVSRGAWVHTDSHFVAGEVTEALGVPAERVRAIYPGGPVPPTTVLPGTGGDSGVAGALLPGWVTSYVLAVGKVEPRKGLPGLVRAFGRFAGRHPGLALVIAGPDGWGSEELARAVEGCPVRDRVLELGWVDRSTRDALVQSATVLAYPSFDEGFGLPPLEAMAAGTPVVASEAGALPEVLGDAAWLVGPRDEDALAGALEDLVDDPSARQALCAKGLRQVARYSWAATADGLASLYHEAALAAAG